MGAGSPATDNRWDGTGIGAGIGSAIRGPGRVEALTASTGKLVGPDSARYEKKYQRHQQTPAATAT